MLTPKNQSKENMDISQYITSVLFIITLCLLNDMQQIIIGDLTFPSILCFLIMTKYDDES